MKSPNGKPSGTWIAWETPSSKCPTYSVSIPAVLPRDKYGSSRDVDGTS